MLRCHADEFLRPPIAKHEPLAPPVGHAGRVDPVDHALLAMAEDVDRVQLPIKSELEVHLRDPLLSNKTEQHQSTRDTVTLPDGSDAELLDHSVLDQVARSLGLHVDIDRGVVGRAQPDVARRPRTDTCAELRVEPLLWPSTRKSEPLAISIVTARDLALLRRVRLARSMHRGIVRNKRKQIPRLEAGFDIGPPSFLEELSCSCLRR